MRVGPYPGQSLQTNPGVRLDLRHPCCDYAMPWGSHIMHAQKFQLRYSVVEDRVLIIVTGEDEHERTFALTRRLVKRLIPGLQKILGEDAVQQDPLPFDKPEADSRQEPSASAPTGTEAPAAGQSTPGNPAAPAAATPPATPAPETHLVTRLRIVERPKGTHVLQISDADTTLNVPLNDDQLNNFTRGILTVLGRADWNLSWQSDMADEAEQPSESGPATIDITADSPSRYKH